MYYMVNFAVKVRADYVPHHWIHDKDLSQVTFRMRTTVCLINPIGTEYITWS